MHTLDEATESWCPMTRVANGNEATNCAVNQVELGSSNITKRTRCIANECMMWRWSDVLDINNEPTGFCGLAGVPL